MRIKALLAALAITGAACAQYERVEPLHRQVDRTPPPALRSGGLNEVFLYANDTVELPIVDDFSVDRTRHLSASSADANVTYLQSYFQLSVGGVSTPDMVFMLDTTFHFYTDTVGVDSTWKEMNPSLMVDLADLSVYPVVVTPTVMWPAYDIYDTLDMPTDALDTLHKLDPDLRQDSLKVYSVAPDTRTYTNPDLTESPYILWADDAAYINGTYPVDPPTIGVASFDGMDRTGFPYQPENPNSNGIADTLTSVPINLNDPPEDSIYMSFLYQPQGLSGDDQVQTSDSLRLEFFAAQDQEWRKVWSTPYTALHPFKNVMIPITDPDLLKTGFRMRFSNRATLGGALDHWHIDYVRLGRNRAYDDTVIVDVSWVYPANTLLSPWTSMPFKKFNENPAAYMASSVDLQVKNLDMNETFITWGYNVTNDCGDADAFSNYGTSVNGNANTSLTTNHPVNSTPNDFSYDVSGCTDAGFNTVKFWLDPDNLRYNDTTAFVQELSNYYSYDDGSAEAGYWLNTQTGKIAYRFDTQGQDSLRAVRMYFDPIFSYADLPNDPRDGNFLITIWSDLNNDPIFQNISFSSPDYNLWGPNKFVEYPLDDTILVGGTFYVGWSQTSAVKMNLGLDKNRVNNDKMYYDVGNGWVQSQQQGSWMIRPVMVSEVDPFAGVAEPTVTASMLVFPNPTSGAFTVRITGAQARTVEVTDITGRALQRANWNGGELAIDGLAPALYMVRALGAQGNVLTQERLVVQR
jgi:hypothetical protein